MAPNARAPLHSGQTLAMIESSPLSSAAWEALADKMRAENDPLSVKSLEVIIRGVKKMEEASEKADGSRAPELSELSQSMFVRLARAYNSPTLLKEVGLIYLRDLALPDVALEHFGRSLLLGGPEKELRPLSEAAAVAVQRQIAQKKGAQPQLSGMAPAHHVNLVATTIIRRTGKMLLPAGMKAPGDAPAQDNINETRELAKPLPNTAEECIREAEDATKRGSLARAEMLLQKASGLSPDARTMYVAWTHLGEKAFERNDHQLVELAFGEAVKAQPNELPAHFNAALGYQLNQKYDKAIVAYARANELQAGHPKIWCNLGALHFQVDAYTRAEEALRRAVSADPQYARAWDNLAATLGAQDKLDEALRACKRAVELKPDYPEARFKMGVIYFSKSDWDNAMEQFARAAAEPMLAAHCEAFLAMIYARLEQKEAAETAIRRAAEIDPQCDLLWMAWNDLGLAWFVEKDYVRAARAYGEATLLKPDEPGAWFNLGVSYHQSGDLKAARDSYQQAADLNSGLAEAWHNLGTVCAEMNDLPAAVAAFSRETTLAPANVQAWHDLGVASEKMGQADEAETAFARARELTPPRSNEALDKN